MEQITLNKVNAFELSVSIDEYKSAVSGYYKDSNIASTDAKGAGWYNSDGIVKPIELWTDGETIYKLEKAGVGKFTDVDAAYRHKTLESIKSKLSKEELELLGIN